MKVEASVTDSAECATAYRSIACLRREPDHRHELVSQLVMGEEALVLDAREAWLFVESSDGYRGWVHGDSCIRSTPEDGAAFRERLATGRPRAGTWIVCEPRSFARTCPDESAPIASDLVHGARVGVARSEDGWAEVALPNGTTGWVPAKIVMPYERLGEAFPTDGSAIIAHGTRFLGVPYLWGGTSEKGFDCSGFTQRIFGFHGIRLPRDSDQQAGLGERVEIDAGWRGVRDGDLAFFSEGGDGRVTHVGVLASGGRLLHASTTRNGVAWDTLHPRDPSYEAFGSKLMGWLTEVRRVL